MDLEVPMNVGWIWFSGLVLLVAGLPSTSVHGEQWSPHDVVTMATGGVYIGTDDRSGDSVIRVGPSGDARPRAKIFMDHDSDSGDRVIQVLPPPEQERENEVIFGPMFITPEIIWPGSRPPHRPVPIRPGEQTGPRLPE